MGSGYRGRIAIFELMLVNDELRTAINTRQDTSVLNQIAKKNGMRTLRDDGLLKVQKGWTTESEVIFDKARDCAGRVVCVEGREH